MSRRATPLSLSVRFPPGSNHGGLMKLRCLLLVATLLWSTHLSAQVNALPSQPHLLVKGQAERTVMPDRFTLDFLVQATMPSPGDARAQVERNVATVLALFKANRALTDSIHASTLSISPEHAFEEGKQVFKGTKVVRRVRATFVRLEDVRTVLSGVESGPELQITGIRSGYAGAAGLRAELKREAAQQSRRSAEGLASAYGTRITGLYTVSDVAPSFAYGVQAGMWPAAGDDTGVTPPAPPAPTADIGATVEVTGTRIAPATLQTGTITFSENVYAIFLISP